MNGAAKRSLNGAEGDKRQEQNLQDSQSMEVKTTIKKCCENERGCGSAYYHYRNIGIEPLLDILGSVASYP